MPSKGIPNTELGESPGENQMLSPVGPVKKFYFVFHRPNRIFKGINLGVSPHNSIVRVM